MAIKIKKEPSGSFAKVTGITVDPIPVNSFVCGETLANDRITIYNPDQAVNGDPRRVLYNIHFTEFVKSDDSIPADVNELAADINAQLEAVAPTDTAAGYSGLYNSTTNTPDIATDIADYNNGDWFWVSGDADVDLGNGVVSLKQNDQVKLNITYDTDGVTELSREWNHIEDTSAKISAIESSAINEFDIVVDSDYLGVVSVGSALQPYKDLATAIANSTVGDNILVKGSVTISAEVTLPHSLNFYGTSDAEIKYANYDATNGNIFSFEGDMSDEFRFENIDFINAGGYGIYIKKCLKVAIINSTFKNNGWDGTQLNTILSNSESGLLGYDSSNVDLQAFYAGSHASNGGGIRIEEVTQVEIINNSLLNNLRGIRLQDCGIGGYGFVSRNQISQNIESGIYLASSTYDATKGCENFTVYNNASKYNSNNGILVIGGIDNVISLNIVEGNWNAGVMGWHVSNTRFRDLDLTNNNRSQYNGIGNTGDAHSSITIGGNTAKSDRGYIASILSCEIYDTGLGSNTSKIGFQILQDVEDITGGYDKNLINILHIL